MQDKRIPMIAYVTPTLATLARDAARAVDQSQSTYLRTALLAKMRADGHDLAELAGVQAEPREVR